MQRHIVTQRANWPIKQTYLLWCKSASNTCLDTKWYSTPSFSWLFRGLVVSFKERMKAEQRDIMSQWASTVASLCPFRIHRWFVYTNHSIHPVSRCQAQCPFQEHHWFTQIWCRKKEASHLAGEGTERCREVKHCANNPEPAGSTAKVWTLCLSQGKRTPLTILTNCLANAVAFKESLRGSLLWAFILSLVLIAFWEHRRHKHKWPCCMLLILYSIISHFERKGDMKTDSPFMDGMCFGRAGSHTILKHRVFSRWCP